MKKKFLELSHDEKNAIHEVLFQMDILELNDDDKVEAYYNSLPDNIIKDGVRHGFGDSVIQEIVSEWFTNNPRGKNRKEGRGRNGITNCILQIIITS